jgi:hypothetical protein
MSGIRGSLSDMTYAAADPVAKSLHHPTRSVIAFDHASFQFHDDPSLKPVI